jgi:quinol monooxygenase YgiN
MSKSGTSQMVCVAEFHAFHGKEQELVNALHVLMEPTHKEQGCLRYELNQGSDDLCRVTFIEKWKDQEAFDQHCATSYIKNFFDNLRPLLVEEFEVTLYREILP